MALTLASLDGSWSTTNSTSYTTASFTYTAGRLLVVLISQVRAATTAWAGTPTVKWTTSGTALTRKGTGLDFVTAATNRRRLECFVYTGGAGITDTLTISTSDTVALIGDGWSVVQWDGWDSTVATPDLAIVQLVTNSGTATSGSATLAAAGDSLNRPMSVWEHAANQATTPRTNWTELHDVAGNNPTTGFESQYRSDAFETTASASWVTSSDWGGLAVEIKALVPLAAPATVAGVGAVPAVTVLAEIVPPALVSARSRPS